MPGFESLPSELLLAVAEQMNIPSVRRLMLTNKNIAALIQDHEASISRAQMTQFANPPRAKALSSSTPERHILDANTFRMVQEMELRRGRLEQIMKRSDFLALHFPPAIRPLSPEHQEHRLLPFLRMAVAQCDEIADVAANLEDSSCDVCGDAREDQPGPQAWQRLTYGHAEGHRVRVAQIKHIQSLGLAEVMGVMFLVTLVSCGYSHGRRRREEAGDPAAYERITMFEECTLRHGSWFLWSHMMGGARASLRAAHLIEAGLDELSMWELGFEEMLPGLKMTVMNRFRQLAFSSGEDWESKRADETIRRMLRLVREHIFGEEEEENDDDDSAGEDEEEAEGYWMHDLHEPVLASESSNTTGTSTYGQPSTTSASPATDLEDQYRAAEWDASDHKEADEYAEVKASALDGHGGYLPVAHVELARAGPGGGGDAVME